MSIYYHGTNKRTADLILKEGFRIGTYFTWDLHSSLIMGGKWVFGVYFIDKDPSNSYWEFITPKLISREEILFLRKFDIKCIFDNELKNQEICLLNFKEDHGDNISLCDECKGKGQLNTAPKYKGWKKSFLIVCPECKGFGFLNKNRKENKMRCYG